MKTKLFTMLLTVGTLLNASGASAQGNDNNEWIQNINKSLLAISAQIGNVPSNSAGTAERIVLGTRDLMDKNEIFTINALNMLQVYDHDLFVQYNISCKDYRTASKVVKKQCESLAAVINAESDVEDYIKNQALEQVVAQSRGY